MRKPAPAPLPASAFKQLERPEVGKYKMRLAKGGPWVPVLIFRRASQPDRSPMLRCQVAGEERDPFLVWPWCWPVSDADYARLLENMPDDPRQRLDISTAPPPSFDV